MPNYDWNYILLLVCMWQLNAGYLHAVSKLLCRSLPWFLRKELLERAVLKSYDTGVEIPLNDGGLRSVVSGRFSVLANVRTPGTHGAHASSMAPLTTPQVTEGQTGKNASGTEASEGAVQTCLQGTVHSSLYEPGYSRPLRNQALFREVKNHVHRTNTSVQYRCRPDVDQNAEDKLVCNN